MTNIVIHQWVRQFLLIGIVMVGLSACQTTTLEPTITLTATDDIVALSLSFTPIPTVALASPTSVPTATESHTPQPTLILPTVTDTMTPIPTVTDTPTETALPTITPTLAQVDHYWLQRPIAQEDGNTHWLDRTYPYGGTQFGTREVHLGVEFANSRFTPVFSAAEGRVVFAGVDTAILFGPRRDYYGNLVVIEHPFQSPDGLPVYTLYAHMQDVAVSEGQVLLAGQRVGRVGDSGIAVGPHLHFEVRVGDVYDYRNTLNPDLWIQPYRGFGTLAGLVSDIDNPNGVVLQVRSDRVQRETYTYGSNRVNADSAWRENFTLGDLPAGQYEVIVNSGNGRNLFRETVSIIGGQTTFINVNLNGSR
ncbi:MAG: peptidoglycan DD-metalloendopeptidase family protein [Anaerolineae bacterium]|nr:peptidoglycan DD-metalloendopeptidase family protein [Anaerolineae bacterium]